MNKYRCAGCLADIPAKTYPDGFEEAPSDGIFIPVQALGYYGGFIDLAFSEKEIEYQFVCHDCWVKVLEVLPGLKQFMVGGHPADHTKKPCCNYAWSADFSTKTHYQPVNGEWTVDEHETTEWRKQT